MPVSEELLEILVCPETRQPVSVAGTDLIARLNGEIESGQLRNRGGDPVSNAIQEGLLREDGKILYPKEDRPFRQPAQIRVRSILRSA